jgi:hypothetical protein
MNCMKRIRSYTKQKHFKRLKSHLLIKFIENYLTYWKQHVRIMEKHKI